MRMYYVEFMLLNVLYSTMEMVVGLEMCLPGLACCKKRLRKKRDKSRGCSCVAWSKQRHVMTLRDLFLDQLINDMLCSTIILRRNSYPGGRYLTYSHDLSHRLMGFCSVTAII